MKLSTAEDDSRPKATSLSDDTRTRLMVFVGATVMLVVLLTAIVYVLWGSPISLVGSGLILYGGSALALLVVAVYVAWSWKRWRDSITGT